MQLFFKKKVNSVLTKLKQAKTSSNRNNKVSKPNNKHNT